MRLSNVNRFWGGDEVCGFLGSVLLRMRSDLVEGGRAWWKGVAWMPREDIQINKAVEMRW